MEAAFLGIDLGTTGIKSVVFDEKFKILGQKYITSKLIKHSDTEIEQDADEWWNAVVASARAAIKAAGIPGDMIRALSVSSQGIAIVPVDKNIRPLRNAISWLDSRALEQKQQLLQQLDMDTIFKATGKRASEVYTLPKLMWLLQYEPQIYKAAWKFLMPHDFIIAKLTSKAMTDRSMAAGTMLYDIENLCWSEKLADVGHIDISKLPEVVCAGTVAGKLCPDSAEQLGLSCETLAVVGGQDQKCAALGAGINDSIATVSLGTAGAVIRRIAGPVSDSEMRIPVFPDVVDKRWVLEGVAITACESLEWLRDTLFSDNSFVELDAFAENAGFKQNGVLFYPYLAGSTVPVWDMAARSMFWGLNLSSTKGDIVRSVLEGVAFQLKSILDVMSQLSGVPEMVNIFGGGTKSPLWCSILANVFGVGLNTLDTSETASVGAAILAALGCGAIKDLKDVQNYINIKNTYYPEKNLTEAYKEKYEKYNAIAIKMLK
jgi:xylulokinase